MAMKEQGPGEELRGASRRRQNPRDDLVHGVPRRPRYPLAEAVDDTARLDHVITINWALSLAPPPNLFSSGTLNLRSQPLPGPLHGIRRKPLKDAIQEALDIVDDAFSDESDDEDRSSSNSFQSVLPEQ